MQTIMEYFSANLGTNIALSITALVIAIIFVIVLEKYFNITLKELNTELDICDPVGKLPDIKDPVGKWGKL